MTRNRDQRRRRPPPGGPRRWVEKATPHVHTDGGGLLTAVVLWFIIEKLGGPEKAVRLVTDGATWALIIVITLVLIGLAGVTIDWLKTNHQLAFGILEIIFAVVCAVPGIYVLLSANTPTSRLLAFLPIGAAFFAAGAGFGNVREAKVK